MLTPQEAGSVNLLMRMVRRKLDGELRNDDEHQMRAITFNSATLDRWRTLVAIAIAIVFAVFTMLATPAFAATSEVEVTWKLLDYVAVDYRGAVTNGQVTSPGEFAEMNEFAASIGEKIASLPANSGKVSLVKEADKLKQLIMAKGNANRVAELAHTLGARLLGAYPVTMAPSEIPNLANGQNIFRSTCSSCHGTAGDGQGPAAKDLSTPPIAFTDIARARERSVFGLQQVVKQGIDGTAMQGFADMPDADRWAVALYVSNLAFSDSLSHKGETLWRSDPSVRARIPDLRTLFETTPAELGRAIGQDKADAVMAHLRLHPDAFKAASPSSSLSIVRGKLSESLAAYRRGDRAAAKALALSAYLDGFEPIEPTLRGRDATLLSHIEGLMGEYRAAVESGEDAEALTQRVAILDTLFSDAEEKLSDSASSTTATFLGAFTILLREGLEALLIVVAMLAFLRKAERPEVIRYIHAGWLGALIAGVITWLVATYAIGISGASRELTEGFGSLFAAVILLSVGLWMHGKAQAGQWQRYINEKLSGVLDQKSGWFLFGLAFLVVYREVFETILFYAALWAQGSGLALLAGMLAASALLGAVGWLMLRYSRNLPVAEFFRYSSWLMAMLTVVLAGKGVAALQEAGILDIRPLTSMPRISVLGVFPTVQSIGAQLLLVAAIVSGFAYNRRSRA